MTLHKTHATIGRGPICERCHKWYADRIHKAPYGITLAEQARAVRICPACLILPAALGDRYCADCGSARDREAWAED